MIRTPLDAWARRGRPARSRARMHPSVRTVAIGVSTMLLVSVLILMRSTDRDASAAVTPDPPAVGDPGVMTPVDLDSLDPDPIQQWGVVGIGTSYTAAKPQVWDFAEIGDRIYVGGNFTGVQRNGDDVTSQVVNQGYLAAFDRDSGAWISTFRPAFDRTIYDLDVSPTGKLLVAGEFTSVNGAARTGLVALDPISGATDQTFGASVTAPSQPMVRSMIVDGQFVYIGGQIANVVKGGSSYWVWNAARLNATTGGIDGSFVPKFVGGVWDLALDPIRDRVSAVGSFTSVGGASGTSSLASVTRSTGALVPGLAPYEFNTTGQHDLVAIGYADNHLYVGGSQHIIQVLDAETNGRIGYSTTGLSNAGVDSGGTSCARSWTPDGCGFVAGGDFQVVEVAAGGQILAGCHCFDTWSATSVLKGATHYSSFTGARTDNRVAIGYRSDDHTVASSFVPGLKPDLYGTYALFVDSNGCYYVGGYYVRQTDGQWIGGFGRFCRPVQPPTSLAAKSVNGSVSLSWKQPADQHLPTARYSVFRDGTFIGDATGLGYGDSGLAVDSNHTYTVKTVDAAGRISEAATVTIKVAGADTVAPTPPPGLSHSTDVNVVSLSWEPATDRPDPGGSGISGYLVHRDYNYLGFVPASATAFTEPDVADGTHRYDVRAVDNAGNYSTPATATVTVGAVDEIAPTTPTGVAGTVDGTSATITWQPSTDLPNPGGVGLSGYLVHRDYQYVGFVPAGTETFTEDGLTMGAHRYEVRSIDREGNYGAPGVVSVTVAVADSLAPTVPTGLAAVPGGTNVTVTWGASTDLPDPGGVGLSGYLVHRDYVFVKFLPAGTTTFVDSGVAAGAHRYEVRSIDRNGTYSEPAVVNASVGALDTQAPTVPSGVAGAVVGGSPSLTWTASTDLPDPGGVGVSGYLIHRDYQFIKWVPAGTLNWVDLTAASGVHRYEVRSVDKNNNISAPAAAVQLTAP